MKAKTVISQLPGEVPATRGVVVIATVTEPRRYYSSAGTELIPDEKHAMRFTAGAASTEQILGVVERTHGEKMELLVIPEVEETHEPIR